MGVRRSLHHGAARRSSEIRSAGSPVLGCKLVRVSTAAIRWVGVAIDCVDVGPAAHFYERLLGFELTEMNPPDWAQLFNPAGGVHLNIQGAPWYQPPMWPESPGQLTKMIHLEVAVDDIDEAVATAIDAGGLEAPWQPIDRDRRLRVILDPAGHPLCLFLPGE
jgi:predicted enzyme related to lactoylglutathione lyase